jgi:chromosome segregation ATPase
MAEQKPYKALRWQTLGVIAVATALLCFFLYAMSLFSLLIRRIGSIDERLSSTNKHLVMTNEMLTKMDRKLSSVPEVKAEIVQTNRGFQETNRTLHRVHDGLTQLQRELTTMDGQLNQIDADLSPIIDIRSGLAATNTGLQNANSGIKSLGSSLAEIGPQMRDLNRKMAALPAMQQSLDDTNRGLLNFQKDVDLHIGGVTTQMEALQKQIHVLNTIKDQMEDMRMKIGRIDALQEELKNSNRSFNKANDTLVTFNTLLQGIAKELNDTNSKIGGMQKQINRIEREGAGAAGLFGIMRFFH